MSKTDNELIAEFMGATLHKEVWTAGGFPSRTWDFKQFSAIPIYGGEMLFATSWDWLMPVVEKIENLGISTKIDCDGISTNVTIRHISVWENPSSKIEKVYKALLEFIKWYNQNKP